MTSEQRRQLDELAALEGKTLARMIREAVTAYRAEAAPDIDKVLAATFCAELKSKLLRVTSDC